MRVNISAGEDDADARNVRGQLAKHHRSSGSNAGSFDKDLHAKQHEAQRVDYLFVSNRKHIVGELLNDRERQLAGNLYAQAVGDCWRRWNRNAFAFQKRLARVVSSCRFNRITAYL